MDIDHLDHNRSGRGNTESPARINENEVKIENRSIDHLDHQKTQGALSRYWVFTWNNYENIGTFEQILKNECEWYLFQEETGEGGTPHLQGTICLKKRQRLTAIKKWVPAIHWEITRSIKASIEYSTKYATRTGKVYMHGITIDVPDEIEIDEPYGWQLQVLDIIKEKPDKRTIHWFWEPWGGVGKTELCRYLCVKHNAIMLTGKSNDMYHALSKRKPKDIKLVIINVPRSIQDYINYGAIEQIKDGLVFSGKYESTQLIFNHPHVIVFANEPPDQSKMSGDRWNIIKIKPDDQKVYQ